MTKWEYLTLHDYHNTYHLNELGEEGWELCAVYDGAAYFRRPKKSVPVRVGPTEHKTPSEGPSV